MKKVIAPAAVALERIHPNNWNPNSMKPEIFDALVQDIKQNGFLGAILVRKCQCKNVDGNHYEIIDGEHRWLASQDRRIDGKEIPCYVVERDDVSARIETVTRNREHGELVEEKLLKLIDELSTQYKLSHEDIRTKMFVSEQEFKLIIQPVEMKVQEIMKIELQGRQRSYMVSVKVGSKDDYDFVNAALDKIMVLDECDKGYALMKVFTAYTRDNSAPRRATEDSENALNRGEGN